MSLSTSPRVIKGGLVVLDTGVRARRRSQDLPRGPPEAGSEFDDVAARDARIGEQPRGRARPAGTQHAFAEASEQPVAGEVGGVAFGHGQGRGIAHVPMLREGKPK